jgi:hypothetical protein
MKKNGMNRRGFMKQLLAGTGAAGLMQRYAGAVPALRLGRDPYPIGMAVSGTVPGSSARLTIPDPEAFRVLQFTDLHFFGTPFKPSRDRQTLEDIPRLIEATDPHLLLVTGDLWHENPDDKGEEYLRFSVEKVSAAGLPWLFVWGNHDHLDDYAKGHDILAQAPHSLYRGGPASGNYTVEAEDRSGKKVWEFICLNTTEEGMQEPQRQWLRELKAGRGDAAAPPAFAVFHIPLVQYQDIWDLKKASGVKFENVEKAQEDGSSFAVLQSLGNVKGCICGHDHINDYAGGHEGIELLYGRATGTAGYGRTIVPKGAKLYTINTREKTWAWESVLPDGTRWTAEEGIQVDRREKLPPAFRQEEG